MGHYEGSALRVRGFLLIFAMFAALLLIGFLAATAVTLPFGGASIPWRVLIGMILLTIAFGVLFVLGRRRQAAAIAARRG